MSLWVTVISASEISVVRGDDCVLVSLLDVLSVEKQTVCSIRIPGTVTPDPGNTAATSHLFHCPIQGPQALARTVAPMASKGLSYRISYYTSTRQYSSAVSSGSSAQHTAYQAIPGHGGPDLL